MRRSVVQHLAQAVVHAAEPAARRLLQPLHQVAAALGGLVVGRAVECVARVFNQVPDQVRHALDQLFRVQPASLFSKCAGVGAGRHGAVGQCDA
jgi:hypothetical protein